MSFFAEDFLFAAFFTVLFTFLSTTLVVALVAGFSDLVAVLVVFFFTAFLLLPSSFLSVFELRQRDAPVLVALVLSCIDI